MFDLTPEGWTAVALTLRIALVTTACATPVGIAVGWLLARKQFWGKALLDGVVDVYLADFKFGNDVCAERLAGVTRYVEIITRNLRLVAEQGDLIVRHLLLPGHEDCCFRPLVAWLREHLPAARLSVREGYLPHWQAEHYTEFSRPLPRGYAEQACDFAQQAGLRLVT